MSFRGEIVKKLLKVLGPDAWNEFWVAFAAKVLEQEKALKDQPGSGQIKAAAVKEWAHARLAPLLPDFTEAAIFTWLDKVLVIVVQQSNYVIGQDWVSGVESLEAYFAQIVEPLLDVDLDGDGNIGTAKLGAVFLLALLLDPGSCQAERRPLVEHYRSPESSAPPADAPRPRSDDVRGTSLSGLSRVTAGTWTGWHSNGNGKSSFNGGLAFTLKASRWQPSLLAGKDGVGAGIAYRRVGVMGFYDGALSAGVYLRPFDL